ncbi:MAG: phospho-N-acetylmuramoyl-pentapeptide-transferase [Firmicutes bacterium]|nr:phospho-N-acetylmuramoyl-pentapeptide-transferase [Bacillota bacterium]
MQRLIIFFLVSFAIALVTAPLFIRLLKKLKAGQSILHYVDFHEKKSGTPTMGGIIFILPLFVLAPFFFRFDNIFTLVILISTLGYALLGFFDDFIKIRTKNNMGLRAYQKIIGQGGIAILVAIFYWFVNPEGRILVPFFNVWWDIGFFIIPLVVIILIATTNSVNLTDGLDGLAGSVSMFYLMFLGMFIFFVSNLETIPEADNFTLISMITMGGLMAYLVFNTNKASIFMGDTGSLYLGGIIATLSIFSFMGLFILFLGIMFVVSALSDIIQVIYFKKTGGKRVFLMAPYHHHLEKKGFSEAKIVVIYSIVTVIMGTMLLLTFFS